MRSGCIQSRDWCHGAKAVDHSGEDDLQNNLPIPDNWYHFIDGTVDNYEAMDQSHMIFFLEKTINSSELKKIS